MSLTAAPTSLTFMTMTSEDIGRLPIKGGRSEFGTSTQSWKTFDSFGSKWLGIRESTVGEAGDAVVRVGREVGNLGRKVF